MKTKSILLIAGSMAMVPAAYAQQTVNITGATAFRSAAVATIRAVMNGQAAYKYGHSGSAGGVSSATRSIFIGSWPGLSGTTTIRCHWTGSVEGVRALSGVVDPAPPTYLLETSLDSVTAASGGAELAGVTATTSGVSDLAFSDVAASSTPYAAAPVTAKNVGVIVFAMVSNKGSVIDNVTSQQYRAVLSETQPLSLFTNIPANTSRVVAVGRNDLSGTRTTYLAESGFGITKKVKQYMGTVSSGNLTTLTLAPFGVAGGTNTSTVWGQDVAGNGGYASGGGLVPLMTANANSTQIVTNTGSEQFPAARVDAVTFVSISDAGAMKLQGANITKFNGVGLDLNVPVISSTIVNATAIGATKWYRIETAGDTNFTLIGAANNTVGTIFQATGAGTGTGTVKEQTSFSLSTADQDKIKNGAYTAWGFEKLFRKNTASAAALDVFNDLDLQIKNNLGTAGVRTDQMLVTRATDGGTVVSAE